VKRLRSERERGMALLTTLMLVAVMSAMAVAVLDDVRFGLRRTANADSVGQAQWYALGAEELARTRLAGLAQATPERRAALIREMDGRPFAFPIEGGMIRGRLEDAQRCFNLNSLVSGVSGGDLWLPDPAAVGRLGLLITAVGSPQNEAQAVARAAVDWIDTDLDRSGAEDEAYARRTVSYRTAEQPFAEASELRAVQGVTPALYARLRPHVCALPPPPQGAQAAPVNVNTLRPEDAVLLATLLGGRVSAADAERVIASRPAAGWRSEADFRAHPLLADLQARTDAAAAADGEAGAAAPFGVETRFFALSAEVDYNGAEVVMSALFELEGDAVKLRARRWTVEE